MSRGISRGKKVIKFADTSSSAEFDYSIKTRRRFHNHAKCTYRVLAGFTSLLIAMRTSTVAIA